MDEKKYPGPERRRFRRLVLRYPVYLETISNSPAAALVAADGMTVNLSFGGALIDLAETKGLRGRFIDKDSAVPVTTTGVVWRCGGGSEDGEDKVAVEFDEPLLAYEGAIEIADRLEWLREMGGDDFLRELVDLFLDSVPESIQRAQDACHAGDLEAVAQITRSLKSSAGNVGAVNLYEVARRAEQAARESDAATAGRFVDSLKTYFRAAKREVEDLFGTDPSAGQS